MNGANTTEKKTLGGRLDKFHTKELIFLHNLSLNTSTNQLISADYVTEVKLKIEIGRKRKNVRESSATKPLSQDFINCFSRPSVVLLTYISLKCLPGILRRAKRFHSNTTEKMPGNLHENRQGSKLVFSGDRGLDTRKLSRPIRKILTFSEKKKKLKLSTPGTT